MVSVVIDNIPAGVPRTEILQSYQPLTDAELAREGTAKLSLEGRI